MKNETVVRQNRCDREMNTLLFGCFFLYFAMQLFIGETEQAGLVNGINMVLYLVFVPGFLFRLGYCFERTRRLKSDEQGKKSLGRDAFGWYLCFFAVSLGYFVLRLGLPLRYSAANLLTLLEIPGVSAVFLAMAIALLGAKVFYAPLGQLAAKEKKLFLVAALFALTALLHVKGEAYAITGALVGADSQQAVPVIPYFAYFLLGIWFEEKKPGFQWKLAGAAVVAAVLSGLLYRTPLQNLCRVTLSLLPVYVVYVVSELLSDVTLRFRIARFVTETVELVFAAYALMMFALCFTGRAGAMGPWRVLLLAAVLVLVIYGGITCFWLCSGCYTRMEQYFKQRVKHRTAVYFLVYTVIFALLLFLAFFVFLRDGKTLLWQADTVSQYYPRAVYFANYMQDLVKSIFSGNFELPMYDFRLGMGGEVTYSLEPLYFLFALFGADKVEFTYTLVILLRFYLAGITSSVFFLYFKKDYFTTFIASCVYVFCGFSLFGGARHGMFMIPMIMFPLLIIAMEEIIQNKRWYLCTIFVAVSLFSNYYFLYMSTIGMGIYFIVRFFCQKEREKRTFGKFITKGLMISGSYLLGVAMSCIVLVTTFGLYVGSGRSGASVIKTPSLFYYSAEWIVRCIISFLTTAHSPGDWLKLGFLPIAFLAVVLLFVKKGRKELKILSVIAAVLMAIPLSGFVFNGFSSISNRWCFMIALLVAYIVADCMEDLRRLQKREMVILAGASGIYGFLAFFGNYLSTWYTKIAFICLAVTFVSVLLCQDGFKRWKRGAKQCLLFFLTLSMVFVNSYLLYSSAGVVNEYTDPGETQRRAENSPLRAVEELEDDSFYRVSTPKLDYSTISSSIILDYNSISMFNSTFNGSIMEYLEHMGSTSYSVTQLFGLSNRVYLNALASVKYYAYYDEAKRALPYGYEEVLTTDVDGRETTICENKYALPLGYTYSKSISREELEAYDTLERQEVLMQRVMLEDTESQGTEDISVTLEPLEVTKVEEEDLHLLENSLTAGEIYVEEDLSAEAGDTGLAANEAGTGDGENTTEEQETSEVNYKLKLSFESMPNSETYLVLKNAVLEGDMSENPINITLKTEGNNLSYKFRSDDDRYGSGQQDYVFNLGYHEEAITSCEISFDRAGEIRFDSMELYSQPMDNLEQYTEGLTEDVLEHVSIGTNQVTGDISLEEDKILVLSIPFQNGWKAYVDGEETKLTRANYMYMALPLTAGDHEIRLTFEIPGVKYALVIMPSAVVLFVVLLLVRRFRRRKPKRKE